MDQPADNATPLPNHLNVELTGIVEQPPAKVSGKGLIPDRTLEDPETQELLDRLMSKTGAGAGTLEYKLVRDLVLSGLKLIPDGRGTGELKLITAAVKEMRYAYNVFARYAEPHKVTIFGSARTPEDHPDFKAAIEFSRLMAEQGWMAITGAGDGIMKAGHMGPGAAKSFGVAIRLPFETNANTIIRGDEKLIHFRYFFTRKLMFLSQAEAVVLFPGGFGTMDEAYETLTLVQTGKATPMPIVLMEGEGGTYWEAWDAWVNSELKRRGWISPEDTGIYYLAKDGPDAVRHILHFYRNYHSLRYVKDDLVIRLKRPLTPAQVDSLNDEFKILLKEGRMTLRGPYEIERDFLDLPRLVFTHTRAKWGMVRRLIDRINAME